MVEVGFILVTTTVEIVSVENALYFVDSFCVLIHHWLGNLQFPWGLLLPKNRYPLTLQRNRWLASWINGDHTIAETHLEAGEPMKSKKEGTDTLEEHLSWTLAASEPPSLVLFYRPQGVLPCDRIAWWGQRLNPELKLKIHLKIRHSYIVLWNYE